MTRIILSIWFSVASCSVLACTVPPAHWSDSPQLMTSSTPTIVLAKVTAIETQGTWTNARFETVKAIRGKPAPTFAVRGYNDESTGDFSGHRDPGFWAVYSGNTVFPGDCKAYGMFKVGESYLVFLDGPNYPRSFENVKSEDDLWFQTVLGASKLAEAQW